MTLNEGEEICSLVGHWKIIQKIKGHRWSTDDLVTAWFAIKCIQTFKVNTSKNTSYVDFGCGIGSVALMVAWKFTELPIVGIEAQKLSYSLALRNFEMNVDTALRSITLYNDEIGKFSKACESTNTKYDIITGTPPYFKVKKENMNGGVTTLPCFGGLPTCEQSAPARYEFRGGVEEYCAAAARSLADDGIFIVCQGVTPKDNETRVYKSCIEMNFKIINELAVKGREKKPTLFSVYCLVKNSSKKYKSLPDFNKLKIKGLKANSGISPKTITVRDLKGDRTTEYNKLMLDMGICP